ncbi:MAG TPA: hypothetical protein VFL54_05155 [Gammaproteobacteria bacterium]|nr:hypothetical protein [Gammaproteobacteria bacterium]
MQVAPAVVFISLLTAAAAAYPANTCPIPAPAQHPERWRGESAWQALAQRHYRIGDIHIHVAQVYDLDTPGSDAWYARMADALHVKTRPQTVRDQLLFRSGEPVEPSLIYQTERRLRALTYLRRVAITPAGCSDGRVAVDVDVKDAWTLKPEITFKRVGGQNIVNFRVAEHNFLGYGKLVSLGRINDVQRSDNYASYFDPALGGSRWQMTAGVDNFSDGYSRRIAFNRPFFADTAGWAAGTSFLTQQTNANFYDDTHRAWYAADQTREFTLSAASLLDWNGTGGWRAGARYVDESFNYGPPVAVNPALRPPPLLPNRQFRGVQGTLDFFQDRYASFYNLALVGHAEDYNLGWTVSTALGYFPTSFGSSTDAWIGSVDAAYGLRLPDLSVMFFNAHAAGRHARGAWRGSSATAAATYYNQAFDAQTLVAHLAYDWQLRPDPEDQLYLGGLSGMRGYPNYFRAGDRRWQATFEDRIATATDIWQTFQLGYVAFVDAGQVRRVGGRDWSRVYSDAGFGLRLGNLRSAFANVITMVVAVPLVRPNGISSYQIVIGDVVTF